MRLTLLLATLLLPGIAQAASSIPITMELCSATGTNYTENGCPADLQTPLAGANVSDTTSDGSVTCAGNNCVGTIYAYAGTAAAGTPSFADCVAGTGALNQQTQAIAGAGNYQFNFVNLTPGTETRITYCMVINGTNYDDRNHDEFEVAADFFTLGAPGGGTPITENSRFIGPGGNDSNSGVDHANRWLTIDKLNATSLPLGTNVWFLTGDVQENKAYVVSHEGTASDRVVLGTYCMDGGVTPIEYDPVDPDCAAGKAEINGTYELSCGATNGDGSTTCAVDGGGAVPNNTFKGLIDVIGRQYVTIQDLFLKDSAGYGVLIDGANTTPNRAIVQRVEVLRSVRSGLRSGRAVANDNTVMRDNVLDYVSTGYCDGLVTSWPHCLNVANAQFSPNANTGNLAENNIVRNCGGEGIGVVRASGNILRGNVVMAFRRPGLYIDAGSNNIVEHNIVAGGNGYQKCTFREGGTDQADSTHGVAVGSEFYSGYTAGDLASTGNVVRNNILTNVRVGLRIFMQAAARTLGVQTGGVAYGNSFFMDGENYPELGSGRTSAMMEINPGSSNITDWQIANNLFIGEASGACPNISDVTIEFNGYDLTPENANCRGSNATIASNTGLSNDDSWGDSGLNKPTLEEVTPAGDVLNAGTSKVAALIDAANYPLFGELNGGEYNCVVTELDWEKELIYEYSCGARGPTPDLGAIEVP